MKKLYSKPMIIVESFKLNQAISAGCEEIIDTALGGQCGLDFGSVVVFLQDVNGCSIAVEDGSEDSNYLCYHVPTSDNNLFNS